MGQSILNPLISYLANDAFGWRWALRIVACIQFPMLLFATYVQRPAVWVKH